VVIILSSTPITIISEGFEGVFPPSGWVIRNGGDTTTWKAKNKGSLSFENPRFYGKYALCSSDIGYDAIFDDSLITPSAYISGFDFIFIYVDAAFKKFPGDPDTGKILISGFNGTWSPWMEIMTLSSDSIFSGMINITPFISGYDSVKVSFWYGTTFWDYHFAVDNFKLVGYKNFNYDFSADSIGVPTYAFKDTLYTLSFHISNLGLNGDSVDVIYGPLFQLDTLRIFLPPNRDTVIYRPWAPTYLGQHLIILQVLNTNDEYMVNNYKAETVKVYLYPTMYLFVPYDTASPTIDGFIRNSSLSDPGWAGALEIEASDYMGFGGGGEQILSSCKYLFKHNGRFLFIGILNANDNVVNPLDEIRFLIDDNNDKVWSGDSSEGVNLISSTNGWRSFHITPFDTGGLVFRSDLSSYYSISSQSPYYYAFQVEIAIPIDTSSKDPAKIKSTFGDTVGMFIGVFTQELGEHVCWWPQIATSITDIVHTGNIILSTPVGVNESKKYIVSEPRKIYTVDGRRVEKPLKKGVYFIVDGGKIRKMIVR